MSQITHYSIILRLWDGDHWLQRIGTASSLSISARDSTSSAGLLSQPTDKLNLSALQHYLSSLQHLPPFLSTG
ncbi:hypothetical protein A6J66_019965 [Yersinia enterocolitica]|nr:hypothetical protein A6J66_019965 [Yersinia enterocolitica]